MRMRLLQADGSAGRVQDHRALVDRDVARPADGVGGRPPHGRLVVRRDVVGTVGAELEQATRVFRGFAFTPPTKSLL